MSDERWVPDLIVYPHGAGLVVAGGLTFEYGFLQGQATGQVLRNVMKFTTSRKRTWLFPSAVAETVVLNAVRLMAEAGPDQSVECDGNAAPPARVTFTIDRIVPTLSILVNPANWTFPVVVPFRQLFADGDHDGLLLDETATLDENALCRLARVCNRRVWTNPWIEVAVTDCGGNITRRGFFKPGTFTTPTSVCP